MNFSRNGPVINELLPPVAMARFDHPISFKWVGARDGGWLEALLAMNRATTVEGFREAGRPWSSPTFNLTVGDTAGSFGLVSVGRIPVRARVERGFREGALAADEWLGYIPYDAMPRSINPAPEARLWLASANNKLTSDDYPYHLSGTWSESHRALRIRQLFEERLALIAKDGEQLLDTDDFRAMQLDVLNLRAVALHEALITLLAPFSTGQGAEGDDAAVMAAHAVELLKTWDGQALPTMAAPAIFNCFFREFCDEVAAARFDADTRGLFSPAVPPCVLHLSLGVVYGIMTY